MRPKYLSISPTIDEDGIAESQTPVAAGNLTLTATTVTLDEPTLIAITSDGADNGRTFTITGTDEAGNTITDAVTGPSTATVYGAKYFKTVTQIAVDDATAGAIIVGNGEETTPAAKFASQTIPIDRYAVNYSYSIDMTDVAGSGSKNMTIAVQGTFDDITESGWGEDTALWYQIETGTSPYEGTATGPLTAVRFVVSVFSSGTAHLNFHTGRY